MAGAGLGSNRASWFNVDPVPTAQPTFCKTAPPYMQSLQTLSPTACAVCGGCHGTSYFCSTFGLHSNRRLTWPPFLCSDISRSKLNPKPDTIWEFPQIGDPNIAP